jgi:hypothetical protein
MREPLHDLFRARNDAGGEAPETMRRRAQLTADVLRLAAAFAIVIGGGGLAFWFVRPHQAPPAESIAYVQPLAVRPPVEHDATVILVVTNVADATKTMRSWPQTTVIVTGPHDRRIDVPAARYRATLVQLARLGTLRQTIERSADFGSALAQATDGEAHPKLRGRIAYARIDVHLQTPSGS